MKFLCIECDEAMKLETAGPPEDGSIAAIFRCPSCGKGTAMLTNPMETEVVQSLGVKIGPGEKAGGCPFSGMIAGESASKGIGWTQKAIERLERIPEMVRPMAKQGIEAMARDRGADLVTESLLDEARETLGFGG